MPNITGKVSGSVGFLLYPSASGALSASGGAGDWDGHGGAQVANTIKFNASSSNSIYGASATVQPPTIALIAQIKY